MYDVDRDGYISFSDLETIVKHLVGSSLNEEQVGELITRAMGELAELRKKTKSDDGDGVCAKAVNVTQPPDRHQAAHTL